MLAKANMSTRVATTIYNLELVPSEPLILVIVFRSRLLVALFSSLVSLSAVNVLINSIYALIYILYTGTSAYYVYDLFLAKDYVNLPTSLLSSLKSGK